MQKKKKKSILELYIIDLLGFDLTGIHSRNW